MRKTPAAVKSPLKKGNRAAMGDRLPPEVLDLMRRGSMELELWVGTVSYTHLTLPTILLV